MTDIEFNSGNVYRISEKHMENILKAYKAKNITELREKIDEGYIPDITIIDVDYEIKLAKLESLKEKNNTLTKFQAEKLKKLIAERKIAEHHADYIENFGSEPSTQAKSAIKKGVERRELTEQEYENVDRYITLRNESYKWKAKCDLCKEGEIYDTRYDAINDMIRHLTTEHSKKVMEIR